MPAINATEWAKTLDDNSPPLALPNDAEAKPLETNDNSEDSRATYEVAMSPVMCCAGLPYPRSSSAFAADTLAAGAALGLAIIDTSVSIALTVCLRASSFTSATLLRMIAKPAHDKVSELFGCQTVGRASGQSLSNQRREPNLLGFVSQGRNEGGGSNGRSNDFRFLYGGTIRRHCSPQLSASLILSLQMESR